MQTESTTKGLGVSMEGNTVDGGSLARYFPLLQKTLDSIPSCLFLMDLRRQIVLVNKEFAKVFQFSMGCQDLSNDLDRRLGKLVHCAKAGEAPKGCGTHRACHFCGALAAILESEKGIANTQEYRLTRMTTSGFPESLDFRVSAEPFPVGGAVYSLVTLTDTSSEKRRQALERIFFHDLLNTASSVHGLAEMLSELDVHESEVKNVASLLCFASDQLVEEINAQKILFAAERNDLVASPCPTEILPEIQSIAEVFSAHDVARHRFLKVSDHAKDVTAITDYHLLRRVVINLIKNALEATEKGGTVTLDVQGDGGKVLISVHNASVMPEAVKLQIFNRSFSTRGKDRGLGTYSVKLLTDRYLNGNVSFVSEPGAGTIFTVTLPVEWPEELNC